MCIEVSASRACILRFMDKPSRVCRIRKRRRVSFSPGEKGAYDGDSCGGRQIGVVCRRESCVLRRLSDTR